MRKLSWPVAVPVLLLLSCAAVVKRSPGSSGGFGVATTDAPPSWDDGKSVTLASDQPDTIFTVDGRVVGRGKNIRVTISGDAPHTIAARPTGFREKSTYVQPPYEGAYTIPFYFLMEDREPSAQWAGNGYGQPQYQQPQYQQPQYQQPQGYPQPQGAPQPQYQQPQGYPQPYAAQAQPAAYPMPAAPQAAQAPAQPSFQEPAPPRSYTGASTSWAVVVGIEKYREDLPPASNAEADAQAFADFAEKTMGIPPEHIKLLLGSRAGKADVESVLWEWLPRNAVDPSGVVYLFFSGHGAPAPDTGDAYLVPYDADPAYLKTRGIAVSSVYDALAHLKGPRAVAFLDSCFSGGGSRSVIAKGLRPLVPLREVRSTGTVMSFTAAGPGQTTGASSRAPHGLFTEHLLEGLRGAADTDGDRNVSLAELVAHVSSRVATEARLQNREQTPTFTCDTDASRLMLVRGLQR
jgi:hypothetical protein